MNIIFHNLIDCMRASIMIDKVQHPAEIVLLFDPSSIDKIGNLDQHHGSFNFLEMSGEGQFQ